MAAKTLAAWKRKRATTATLANYMEKYVADNLRTVKRWRL